MASLATQVNRLKSRGLTRRQIANRLGISLQRVGNIINRTSQPSQPRPAAGATSQGANSGSSRSSSGSGVRAAVSAAGRSINWNQANRIASRLGIAVNKVYRQAKKQGVNTSQPANARAAINSGVFGNSLNAREALGISRLFNTSGQRIGNLASNAGINIRAPGNLGSAIQRGAGSYFGTNIGYREASLLASQPFYDTNIDRVYRRADSLGIGTVVGRSAAQAGYAPQLDSTIRLPGYTNYQGGGGSSSGGGGGVSYQPPAYNFPSYDFPAYSIPAEVPVEVPIVEESEAVASKFAGRGSVRRNRRTQSPTLATRSSLSIGGQSSSSIGGRQLSVQ